MPSEITPGLRICDLFEFICIFVVFLVFLTLFLIRFHVSVLIMCQKQIHLATEAIPSVGWLLLLWC